MSFSILQWLVAPANPLQYYSVQYHFLDAAVDLLTAPSAVFFSQYFPVCSRVVEQADCKLHHICSGRSPAAHPDNLLSGCHLSQSE